jgi:hypothetical protein
MDPKFKHMNLNDVENACRQGLMGMADVEAYLVAWNATPGRFTVATWRDGAIRQAVKP